MLSERSDLVSLPEIGFARDQIKYLPLAMFVYLSLHGPQSRIVSGKKCHKCSEVRDQNGTPSCTYPKQTVSVPFWRVNFEGQKHEELSLHQHLSK